MNGNTVPLLLWAVNGLLGVVIMLLGYVLRLHKDSDEENRQRFDREIDTLRVRGHDLSAKVAALEMMVRK